MELWGWLVGYVVLFALLHLLLYYVYVRREDGDGVQSPSVADPGRGQSRSRSSPGSDRYPSSPDGVGDTDDSETEADIDGETIRCPHCGSRNDADQTFTYCWNCISGLRQ